MTLSWNAVGLPVGIAAAVSVILHLSGCVDEEPTGVAGAGDSAAIVRGYEGGCVPDVVTSSTESSTDTILVTFTATLAPGQYSCTPNLVQWGIDMADPVGVDTPQGNGFFRIETHPDLHISNMPSLPHAALGGGYSPAQVVIEFDPPVRFVEFSYSRRPQSRAWWVIDGRWQEVQTESTWVQATSRVPGTLNYTLYDEEHLYTNSSPGNWDGWTLTKLSAPADKIQWLKIFGTLAIDDLKIIRKPLNCTPATVQRGQQVRCEVVLATGWTVTGWEFQPDSASIPIVQETSSNREWKGIAAAPGTVTVHVTNGTNTRAFKEPVKLTDRPSAWSSRWGYREGPELTVADHEPGLGLAEGRNCPEAYAEAAQCVENSGWVQPDPVEEPGAGITAAKIPSGPNTRYWYVATKHYNMKRVGNVNPGLLITSPRKHLVPAANLTRDCKRGLGLSNKATVGHANMNQFNQFCGLLGANMTIWIPAALGHEGRGYNGGTGHQTLAEAAAGEPQNDPHKTVEALVYPDSILLVSEANIRARRIRNDISEKTLDGNPINGGPQGNHPPAPMWFWEADSTWRSHNLAGF